MFKQINQYYRTQEEFDTYYEILQAARDMYLSGNWSICQIESIFGKERHTLVKNLKKYFNVKVRRDGKKQINSSVFNEIDNEEKAYWLGFLYADGSVSSTRNSFELALQEQDLSHIEKFRTFLCSTHKILKRTIHANGKDFTAYRIAIRDAQIHDDLIRHGCVPKKSLNIGFPEIPQYLIRHFIRGFFDGDGTITLANSRRISFAVSFTSGCKEFLEELSYIILKDLSISTTIYKDKRSKAMTLEINGGKQGRIKFLDYLYKDSNIYLERKYEKYLECRLRSNDMRRLKKISAELSEKTGV